MDKQGMYSNLNFDHPLRRMSPKIIATIVILAIFTFLWLVIPQSFLYWVLIMPMACLSWAATYGFRNAISDLIKVLRTLENL
jgi:hypothetical protein